MATLRIEHAVHDYETWQQAFDSFAEARAKAGRAAASPSASLGDDPKYLMLDLEGGQDVVRMAVEVLTGPVIPHRCEMKSRRVSGHGGWRIKGGG